MPAALAVQRRRSSSVASGRQQRVLRQRRTLIGCGVVSEAAALIDQFADAEIADCWPLAVAEGNHLLNDLLDISLRVYGLFES